MRDMNTFPGNAGQRSRCGACLTTITGERSRLQVLPTAGQFKTELLDRPLDMSIGRRQP
jgi:hypothetical protein